MAKYSFEFTFYKGDEEILESSAQVSLSKKDFLEMEKFIIEHSYSPETVDIPTYIYEKMQDAAYKVAVRECPRKMVWDETCSVELEEFIPDSFLQGLSAETVRKIEENMPPELLEEESLQEDRPLEPPTAENTLYLVIKQVYFDAIVAGTKKKEYREIKDTTYKKYLECDEAGNPYFDSTKMSPENPLAGNIYAWNDGVCPYIPKDAHLYLSLAVGYKKERDTALVEIDDITFEPLLGRDGRPFRFTETMEGEVLTCDKGDLCFWQIVYHIGKVREVHRCS